LPATTIAIGAHAVAEARRAARGAGAARHARACTLAALAALALASLAKMGIFPRIWHYGFALAMPATVLLVLFLAGGGMPGGGAAGGGLAGGRPAAGGATAGDAVRRGALRGVGAALALLLAGLGAHQTLGWRAQKTASIGAGADRIECFPPQAAAARILLDQIDRLAKPAATIVVLPEGVMLNYLSRRHAPGPHFTFMPLEMALAGDERVAASLAEKPPDVIAVLPIDLAEYGRRAFGEPGYGTCTMSWIRERYEAPDALLARDPRWAALARAGYAIFTPRRETPAR
jgi:hypothetical protein